MVPKTAMHFAENEMSHTDFYRLLSSGAVIPRHTIIKSEPGAHGLELRHDIHLIGETELENGKRCFVVSGEHRKEVGKIISLVPMDADDFDSIVKLCEAQLENRFGDEHKLLLMGGGPQSHVPGSLGSIAYSSQYNGKNPRGNTEQIFFVQQSFRTASHNQQGQLGKHANRIANEYAKWAVALGNIYFAHAAGRNTSHIIENFRLMANKHGERRIAAITLHNQLALAAPGAKYAVNHRHSNERQRVWSRRNIGLGFLFGTG